LPDAFALEWEQGNHISSPGAKLRQGDRLCESGVYGIIKIQNSAAKNYIVKLPA
jgi:hypothetical protein